MAMVLSRAEANRPLRSTNFEAWMQASFGSILHMNGVQFQLPQRRVVRDAIDDILGATITCFADTVAHSPTLDARLTSHGVFIRNVVGAIRPMHVVQLDSVQRYHSFSAKLKIPPLGRPNQGENSTSRRSS